MAVPQVDKRQREPNCGMDHLHGSAVPGPEGRAQDFVPPDESIEALLKGESVELAVDGYCVEKMIGRAARSKLRVEPGPLLGKRGGKHIHVLFARKGGAGRCGH